MKRIWVIAIAIFVLVGIGIFMRANKTSAPKEKNSITKAEGQTYWTCPMHPQIHAEHPGECPICHMKLIEVKSNPVPMNQQNETRTSVQVATNQMALLGVQRTDVEKMNLKIKIPVSGRYISSSSVAFQIYESDLRYVKPGLAFKGASSFYPEEEVTGTISSVDSIVDPTSRTVRVVGAIHTGPRGTPSETGFRGDIELELKDRIAIPESSVVHTGEGDLVYVFISGNELQPRKIKLGIKSEGFYDVLEGVETGAAISSGPNFLIDSESKIKAISIPEEGAPEKSTKPACPQGQHWDTSMSMCMPGKG
jgi:hypothetical protein